MPSNLRRREGLQHLFKKVDPTVMKETRYIAVIVLILSALMQAVFLILGQWDPSVLWGNLYGAVIAVGNFFLMGLTVQYCLTLEPDEAKKRMKLSQQGRMLLLLVLCMIGAALSCFHTVALLVPQFFPRIGVTVRGLAMKGE